MKEYRINFTHYTNDSDVKSYEEKLNQYPYGSPYYTQNELDEKKKERDLVKKYSGKSLKLIDIPEFIKEVGTCVIGEDYIEVYNDYRE